jgi:arylsulfatase A-like enzyme
VTLASVLPRFALTLLPAAVVTALGGSIAGAAATGEPERFHEAHAAAASPDAIERTLEDRAESAVVLVVLDGVRWQDVFEGPDAALARRHGGERPAFASARELMPNVYRLLDEGGVAVGAPGRGPAMSATGPRFISLPGYLEIFAGKPDLACESNDCPARPARTLLDDVAAEGPGEVAVVASWPNIARAAAADASGYPVMAGRRLVTEPAKLRADAETMRALDRGRGARPAPGHGDYRPDAFTAKIALDYLAAARPRLLFVGLGDADEHAHRDDYGRYLDAVHHADVFIGDLARALGGMGARGRHTTILVTADHGRAFDFKDHGPEFPESGRVFLLALGGDARQGAAAGERHTLSDVAPTVRALLGVRGEGEPIADVAIAGR